MGWTILKKKSGYALGLLLCVIGILILLVVLYKLYRAEALTSLSTASEKLLEKELAVWGIRTGLKLVHWTLLGVVFLGVGGAILIARRERIRVVEEVSILLECPYCKNQWRESTSETHLKSMGYPEVRTLSRRKCSKCAKFIRPKIVTAER